MGGVAERTALAALAAASPAYRWIAGVAWLVGVWACGSIRGACAVNRRKRQ